MVEVGAGFTFRRDTKPENFMALGGDETDNINIGNRRQESFEEIGFIRSEIDPIQKGSVTPIATTGRNFLDRSVFENEPGGNFGSLGAVSGLSPLLVAGEQAAAPPLAAHVQRRVIRSLLYGWRQNQLGSADL